MVAIAKIVKGYPFYITTSTSAEEKYKVTEGRTFRLTALLLTNLSAECRVRFYDAVSTATPELDVKVGARETIALSEQELEPMQIDFLSSVAVSTDVSGTFGRIGGYEYGAPTTE